MENILKKIAEFDKVNETKLAKHEVELGVADNLKKQLQIYKDSISKYSKDLDNAYVPIRNLEKIITELKGSVSNVSSIAQEMRKVEDKVSNELDLVNAKIREAKNELGISIDINDVVDLSSLITQNKLSSGIQQDAAKFVKYVNSLQTPKI